MARAYKDWEIGDIIAWCQENNQVEWLKQTAAEKITHPIYPKIANVSKSGKKTFKMDRTQEPIGYAEKPISFVELKGKFIAKFIETTPKEKKASFYDVIANL